MSLEDISGEDVLSIIRLLGEKPADIVRRKILIDENNISKFVIRDE
jgi:hypothetical protein